MPPRYQARHFNDLAAMFADLRADLVQRSDLFGIDTLDRTVKMIADRFERDNPRFKRDLFERACMPGYWSRGTAR